MRRIQVAEFVFYHGGLLVYALICMCQGRKTTGARGEILDECVSTAIKYTSVYRSCNKVDHNNTLFHTSGLPSFNGFINNGATANLTWHKLSLIGFLLCVRSTVQSNDCKCCRITLHRSILITSDAKALMLNYAPRKVDIFNAIQSLVGNWFMEQTKPFIKVKNILQVGW